jgi:hypothetical protein
MSEQQLSGDVLHVGSSYASPFTKVLALGYYDGPTEGVLQCGQDGPVYKFQLLAWDEETQDLRIFGLAPLPATAMGQLADAYARYQTPCWPVWVPSWQAEMAQQADLVLQQAGSIEWIIATIDLLGEILVARTVTGPEFARIANSLVARREWFTFLGLPYSRSTQPTHD